MNLEQLRQVFEEAYNNKYTDFYRKFYTKRGFTPPSGFPKQIEEWGEVPLLSKEDLAAVPVERRIFVPKGEVLFYRASSGTSNRGVVIIARNIVADRSDQARYTKRLLEFMMPHHFRDLSAERSGIEMIGGDPSDLPASAKLASLFRIDGISASVSILAAFTPHLTRAMDLSDVRFVYLWGERISSTKRDLFFKIFPNAHIETVYSLSEVGEVGFSCETMVRAQALYVHPRNELVYWELVDPDSGKPASDYGDVVLTTLSSGNAFPALRYRTGDLARLVGFPCTCGRKSYEILGRATFDRAVIAGGLITSAELERALLLYCDSIEDDFELHLYENSGILPKIELHIRPKGEIKLNPDVIAKNVAESLKISPQRSLADALRDGLVSEVKCVLIPTVAVQITKQRRIFTHE